MAKTIDTKVVSMQFENAAFERNVQGSLKTIDDLKRSLNFKDSAKGFDNINAAAKGVNLSSVADALDVIKDRFSLMGIVGMSVINNLTNRVMQFGEQLVRSFVIDPISTGFQEYETQINAIQTILANTASKGTTMDDVTAALRELNTYADMTIYNFTEMTKNIGTFTAAGVDLDTSVEAIKGIANLAAVSGSNSQQAATAMYQLSQALSSGTVKLMDWNSVVNAGMGGQVFQDALKETARLHGIAIDQMIEDEGSFRETLKSGWLTSTVLTETLAKFTGDLTEAELAEKGYTEDQIKKIQELGTMANDAATKVKTLTQLNDTLKEAAQSGWTQTWELIIGDFEEAKAFFTELSDYFGGLIGESADARNAIVSAWADLGGRESMLRSIRNILAGIMELVKPIGEAMREIFPPLTGKTLFDITVMFESLTERFKMVSVYAPEIKRVFRGIFALFDIGKIIVESLVRQIGNLLSSVTGSAPEVLDSLASIGDFLVSLRDSIRDTNLFDNLFGGIANFIKPIIKVLGSFFGLVIGGFSSLEGINYRGIKDLFGLLSDKLRSFGKLGILFSKIIDVVVLLGEKLKPIMQKIGEKAVEALNKFIDSVGRAIEKIDVDSFLKMLNGGLFAAILLSINKFIKTSKDVVGGGLFAAILISIKQFIDNGGSILKGVSGILDAVKGSLEAYQKSLKSDILLKIAAAIGILALSILILTLIPEDKLTNAMYAISILFLELFASLEVFTRNTGGVKQMAKVIAGLLGIALAMFILSTSMAILASIDVDKLMAGVIAIGILLGELILFIQAQNTVGVVRAQGGLLMLAISLLVLSKALSVFGKIPIENMIVGLIAMAGALTIITVATNALPADLMAKGFSLLVVSGALLVLANALSILGKLSWKELGVSLIGLGATLTILAVGLQAMAGTITGSFSLLVAAFAISILATALAAVSLIPIEKIGIALLALVAVFTVLGIAGAVLTPVVPVLLGLAVAIALLGVAVLATGIGVLALSLAVAALAVGITALSAAGTVGIAALALFIVTIAKLIPFVVQQLALGFISLVETLASGAGRLLEALVILLETLIEGFVRVAPKLVEAILTFLVMFLKRLEEAIPSIIESGYEIILAILKGIKDNIGMITEVGYDIMIEFMNAIANKLPELIEAGWNLIISFIDGLAEAVDKNIPRLMKSLRNLGASIVRGIITGLVDTRGELTGAVRELADRVLSTFSSMLGIHSPSIEMKEQARFIIAGLVEGMREYGSNLITASEEAVNNTIAEFNSLPAKLRSILDDTIGIDPTIRPVLDLTNVEEAAKGIANMLVPKPLNMALAVNGSRGIAGSIPTAGQPLGTEQVQGTNINFTQNNYSPKELSRIDIYRDTKMQLLQARGLVGV